MKSQLSSHLDLQAEQLPLKGVSGLIEKRRTKLRKHLILTASSNIAEQKITVTNLHTEHEFALVKLKQAARNLLVATPFLSGRPEYSKNASLPDSPSNHFFSS